MNFHCIDCNLDKPIQVDGGTGYALLMNGDKVCYSCIALRDRHSMNNFKALIESIDRCTANLKAGATRLEEFHLGAWLRTEPSMLPRWKRKPKSFKTLPDGQVVANGQAHTVRTTFMRRDYNADDVVLLHQILDAQPRTFTFEQTMALKSRRTIDAAEIARVRRGI